MNRFFKKEAFGLWVITVIAVVPIALWVSMKPIDVRFSSIYQTFTSIGQITGLAGIALFAVTLFLSARIKWLEQYFGGLDRLYSVHHTLGVLSFLLLLAHPIFLAANYMQVSLTSAATFLVPGKDLAITLGIVSLLLMMVIIIFTIFGKMKYETLRRVHSSFGIIFFLGALHAFLIPSDISQNEVLRGYILALSGVSLVAYVYRSVLGRFLVPRYAYQVSEVNTPAAGVTEIVMKSDGKQIRYESGQFVFISFDDPGVAPGEVHPFSISSSPQDDHLRIAVKALGDFTAVVSGLSVGTRAYVEGAYGHFSYLRNKNKHQIWVAGGIGITPFLSMARDLSLRKPEGYTVDLYYSVRSKQEIIEFEELRDMENKYKGFRFLPFISDEEGGYLTADSIAKRSSGLFGKDIYVCGPPIMMKNLIEQFIYGGIPKQRIHSEAFKML